MLSPGTHPDAPDAFPLPDLAAEARDAVRRAARRARDRRRHRIARQVEANRTDWTRAVAGCLDRMGMGFLADKLLACLSSFVQSRVCEQCDAPHADVTLEANCGLRVCPTCARHISQRRCVILAGDAGGRSPGAVARVPDYTAARLGACRARVEERKAHFEAMVEHWQARIDQAAEKRRDPSPWCLKHRAANEAKVDHCVWLLARLEDPRWGWKLITISPQWNPYDRKRGDDSGAYGGKGGDLSVRGLRRRMREVRAAWVRVWTRVVKLGGAGSALRNIETSARGHVHAHALVFAPWLEKTHIHKVATDAGRAGRMFVDIRAVDFTGAGSPDERRGAVAEAAKYLVKVPSVLRGEWVAGKKLRAAHPQLVANLLLATRGDLETVRELVPTADGSVRERTRKKSVGALRLLRAHGPLRDAIAAELALPRGIPVPTCRACEAPIDRAGRPPDRLEAAAVARELGAAWHAALRIEPSAAMRGGFKPAPPAGATV